MNATILLAVTSLLGAAGAPAVAKLQSDDPAVRLWIDPSDRWSRGDRVQIHVRAEADGYLLVLHADPAGRVRMLFPLDPFEDHFVRGGRTYEVRGRGDRHAFTIYESRGLGTVLAAWSPDPFRVDQFARGDHWDYTLAATWDAGDDAEVYLLGLAQRMVGNSSLEYDVVQYDVGGWAWYSRPVRYSRLGLYHDRYDRWSFGISIGWGWPYYNAYYYRPYYVFHYYDPWYYDPWYDPWYDRPSWYWGTCLGWCSPRYYYSWGYYRYPRTVVINNYYGSRFGYGYRGRWDGGAYTFKLNPQPRFAPVEPRQRAPLATAVSRRLVSEPVGVASGRRTELVAPARRVLGAGRTVQPAIGGGEQRSVTPTEPQRTGVRDRTSVQGRTPERVEPERRTLRERAAVPGDRGRTETGTATPQGRLEPRRSTLRERATTPETPAERAEPRRSTLRERAVTPAEPREKLESREMTPRRALEREPVERPRIEQEQPSVERERSVREREPAREVRPRLEPRREPIREPSRAAPERRPAPSRDPGPSVRSSPPRSPGSSARPAPSAPRSSPPARPSGGSSGGARRRG